MINPMLNFTIKGVIWYQGESNRNQPRLYSKTFPLMIENWRDLWKSPNLSFYYVQIAPYDYSKGLNSAYLRESQLETLSKTDNIGMVVTLDIGEENNIHPAEKQLVGKRLAYWALANDYGIKKVGFSGPKYKSNKIEGDKMTLKFDFAEKGLSTFGHPLKDFEIAGQDRVFYPAEAKIIRNKTIQAHSGKVKNPVAVRYAWKNFLVGSLFNTQKLPASSFRTDDWEDDFNE
jgi:sialate O-acetylesterase